MKPISQKGRHGMRGTQRTCVLALVAGVWVATHGAAQAVSSNGTSGQTASAAQPESKADDAWLDHVRTLYTSTARDGLKGFDCEVHPDWRTLFANANNGTVDADAQRKIDVLSMVRITLHAHMDTTAAIDWSSGDPPADLADTLNTMHSATKQTLEGFVQFWAPFADASVVPANSQGLDFTSRADGGRVVHGIDKGTDVTETFDGEGVLREFDVKTPDSTVLFTPTFTATDKGLRVTYFLAHIRQNGGADQEMHVRVVYADVDGFTIPSELYMTAVGMGTFDFSLKECKANP